MPKRGLLIMLPMRSRASYPGVEDEVITLPEIVLPPGKAPGGDDVISDADGFDFPIREVGSFLMWEPANAPTPRTHLKESITFHWEGEGTNLPIDDDSTVSWLAGISAQHIARDWGGGYKGSGIMYHEAIGRSGTSFILRDYTDVVWHAGDDYANRTSRAILVVASLNVPPTPEQFRAIRKRTVDFNSPVFAHSDWSATQCPGDQIRSLVSNLRENGYS